MPRPGELKVNCSRCHERDRAAPPVFLRKASEEFVPFSNQRKVRVEYICDICSWSTAIVFERPE